MAAIVSGLHPAKWSAQKPYWGSTAEYSPSRALSCWSQYQCTASNHPSQKRRKYSKYHIHRWLSEVYTPIGNSTIVLTTVTHIVAISQSLRFYHHICSIYSTPFKGTDNNLEAPTTHIIGLAAQIYYMKFRYSIHEDSGTASKHRMGHSPRKYRTVL